MHAEGHALFDKKGQDLVCCAVSTLLQAWEMSCRTLCGIQVETVKDSGKMTVKTGWSSEARILTDSLILNIGILAEQYPQNLKVQVEESHGS